MKILKILKLQTSPLPCWKGALVFIVSLKFKNFIGGDKVGLIPLVTITVPGMVPLRKWGDIGDIVIDCGCVNYNIDITAQKTVILVPNNKRKEVIKRLRGKKFKV